MHLDDPDLPRRLSHVSWLGGGSGAGKSTIARRLAETHGLRVYSTDDAMTDHSERTSADDSPQLAAFIAMSMDERWVARTPEEMLETFHWYRGEAFVPIVEDLLALAPEPVVAEGFRLLPSLVAPLAGPGRAVWLLPTPRFRRTAFEARGSLWAIANRTNDPERALSNLLERDRMFTDRLRTEVDRVGRPAIDIDVGMSEEALLDRVAEALGFSSPTRG